MRDVTAPRLATLTDPRGRRFVRVFVEDPDSLYQDVTDLFGFNFLEGGRIIENIDQPVPSAAITLRREHRSPGGTVYSLAPTVAGSLINRNALGNYARFLKAGRGIKVFLGWDAPGAADNYPADYLECFRGKIDEVDWKGSDSLVELSCRGLGAWLLDLQIEQEREYGDDVGVPIETVMQQILDHNVEARLGPVVLYVPDSPGVMLRRFKQEKKSTLEALRDLAFQIGWTVRFVWQPDGSYRLTLYEPDRAKVVPDWTLGPSNYFDVVQLKEGDADVRNRIRGKATDAAGAALEYVQVDAASIFEYGTRYMEFTEESTSAIDTLAELTAMVEAALADLKAPRADQEIENDWFPVVDLEDLGRWLANGKHYDTDQDLAVVQFRHEFNNTTRRTFIQCRGSVAGASKEWFRRIGLPGEDDEFDPSTINLGNFREVERTPTTVRYAFKPSASVAQIWGYQSTKAVDDPVEPWPPTAAEVEAGADPMAPNFKLDGDTLELIVVIPAGEQITYVQLEPRDADFVAGELIRIRVFGVQDPPSIAKVEQSAGPTGLYTAIALDVVDPQGLGGTLRAWTNPTSASNASPDGEPDGTVLVASAPATIDEDTVFDTPGGPGTLLAAVKVHPGKGKRVFFEYVNSNGTSSGIVSVNLLTNSSIIDEDGELVDGAIKTALQFAEGITPVQVLDVLPGSAPDGTVVLLTTDGQLYRRVGGVWTLAVPAVNITGTIVATQIADAAVTTAKFAAGIRPVRIVGALPGSGDLVGDVVFLTTDSKLYRWTGAAWVATVPTTDLTGTVTTAQIADAAINTAKFAAGIRPVRIVGALPGAGDVQGDTVFLTTDNKLYRWTGAAWTAAVPAADVDGQLIAAQIADAAITVAKFAAGLRPVRIVGALPGAGDLEGDTVYLTTDNKLYRWDGAAWTAAVPTSDLTGTIASGQIADGAVLTAKIADAAINTAKFAAGLRPVRIVAALPGSGDLEGDTVYLTTDDKLYRWTGAAWTAAVPTSDLTGTIASGQIADGAVLTAKIAAAAVDTANLANNAVTSAIIAANAVTATQIASDAVTTPKILAGAVVTAKIAAGAVTANEIAALTITAGQIAAGTITGAKIAATTITAANIAALTITAAEIAAATITAAKIVSGTITTTQIATDTILAGNIAAGAVNTSELAAGAVTAAKITAGTITATEIAALTITAAVIAAGAITTAKIAAGAVTANEIAADTIVAGNIASGAINTAELAAGAVTAAKITAGTITTTEIAALTILAGNIAAAQITTAKIATGAVTANEIAADTITAGQIAAGAVSTSELAALAVTAAKIAAGTITANEIAALTIAAGNIAAGAITTAKIAAGAVTANEIAADTITAGQIAAGAISTSELAALAVTAAKIAAGTITANEIAALTITANEIAAGTITAAKIATGTITANELATNSIIAGKIAAGAINAAAIIVDGVITAAKLTISVLSSVSDDLGIVVAGRLESVNGQSYIDLDATGTDPFIHHATAAAVTTFEVLADGSARFAGLVESTEFSAFAADFSAQVKIGRLRPSGTAEVHSLWLYGDTGAVSYGIVAAFDTVPYGHASDLSGDSGFTSDLRGGDFTTGYVYNFGVMMAKVIAASATGPSGSAPEGTIWCEY